MSEINKFVVFIFNINIKGKNNFNIYKFIYLIKLIINIEKNKTLAVTWTENIMPRVCAQIAIIERVERKNPTNVVIANYMLKDIAKIAILIGITNREEMDLMKISVLRK